MKKELQILLVDDDTIEHIKFGRALKSTDHQITIAKNGQEALDSIKDSKPDLIVMDMNMPDTNGLEFLKLLKSDSDAIGIPCVVMTTNLNPTDLTAVNQLGICGYFLKPLRYQDYERKIKLIAEYWSEHEYLVE